MKHNKKRNTAFIYETLAQELTKSILEKDNDRKNTVVGMIENLISGQKAFWRNRRYLLLSVSLTIQHDLT